MSNLTFIYLGCKMIDRKEMTSDQNKYEELKLCMSLALGKIQNNNKTFNKKMLANDIRKYWMFKSYFFNYCEQLNYFTIIDIDYGSDDPVYDTIDQIDYYTGGPLGMVRLDDMCISYYTYKQILEILILILQVIYKQETSFETYIISYHI